MGRHSIRQRESGRFQARWYDDAGARHTQMFDTRTAAKKFLDRVSADRQRGDYINPRDGERTVREVAELWLSVKTLRPKTAADYASMLRLRVYPAFGNRPVARINALDVQAWVADLVRSGLAPGTVHNAYRVLKGVLDAAVRAGYIKANPALGIDRRTDLPRPQSKEMLFLTAAEVERVAAALPEPWGLMVLFTAVTGLRAGEVTGLRWEHIDLLRGKVRVAESVSRVGDAVHIVPPKNGKVRTVPFTSEVAQALREYAARSPAFAPHSYVWPTPGGDPAQPMHWGRDFYLREWKAAVGRAGLPAGLRFHDLRHTCAALLIAANIPAKAIQAHLGHSSFAITMDRYGHLYPDAQDSVSAALSAAFTASSSSRTVVTG